MTASCLLPGFPTHGWYLGVIVLDVVRGKRVLDYLVFNIMHARTLWRRVAEYLYRKEFHWP
jgi:hypothetical protein